MDSCTYKSITGLDNYEGFKNYLKMGTITSRFSCSDETIVFNSVQNFYNSGFAVNPTLEHNQIGVVINCVGPKEVLIYGPSTLQFDSIVQSVDINGNSLEFSCDDNAIGLICRDYITGYFASFNSSNIRVVLAIFDLY